MDELFQYTLCWSTMKAWYMLVKCFNCECSGIISAHFWFWHVHLVSTWKTCIWYLWRIKKSKIQNVDNLIGGGTMNSGSMGGVTYGRVKKREFPSFRCPPPSSFQKMETFCSHIFSWKKWIKEGNGSWNPNPRWKNPS